MKRLIHACFRILGPVAFLGLTGCISFDQDETRIYSSEPTHFSGQKWIRTELYFALRRMNSPDGMTNEDWQTFLNMEVTPRFPEGFSVVEAYGQWKSSRHPEPIGLDSRIIVILHPDNLDSHEKIEEIRSVFREQTGQQSVLRASEITYIEF